MNIIGKYKEKVKSLLKPKPDYEKMYNEERKNAEHWEFKYNKLYRQLGAIIKESNQ